MKRALMQPRIPSLWLIRSVAALFALVEAVALTIYLYLWVIEQPAHWSSTYPSIAMAIFCFFRLHRWDNENMDHAEYVRLVKEVERGCRLDIRMGE